jgi:D-tyrosyl-tRNA(Tyr) deacylase
MRAVFQRVSSASVTVDGKEVSRIGGGALVLLGVGKDDTERDCVYIAEKLSGLRVFSDEDGKMNLSLMDINGQVLVVSQFTLYGDVKKGKRPSFGRAADPNVGDELYKKVVSLLEDKGLVVKTGIFGAHMEVGLVNDGPVTVLISSEKEF